jgi:hypothetical protein
MRHTFICAMLFMFTACDAKEAVEVKADDEKAEKKSDEKTEAKADEKKEGSADEKAEAKK